MSDAIGICIIVIRIAACCTAAVHSRYGCTLFAVPLLCQMLADDWTSLGDVQYRKIHLYDLDWAGDEDRQLDRNVVAVAKYGGAVAMMRDETKLLKVCYVY